MKQRRSTIVMVCGDQIRLRKEVEDDLRQTAMKFGRTIGPIKTIEDYETAVFATTSEEELAVINKILDKVEGLDEA